MRRSVLLKGQRDAYKEKLAGASPDEAKEKIENLERAVKTISAASSEKIGPSQNQKVPQVLKDINIGLERDATAFEERYDIVLRANVAGSFDRLRVFVDYAGHQAVPGWMPQPRFPLDDFKDAYPEQPIRIIVKMPNIDYRISDKVRAGIIILGPRETQKFDFVVLVRNQGTTKQHLEIATRASYELEWN